MLCDNSLGVTAHHEGQQPSDDDDHDDDDDYDSDSDEEDECVGCSACVWVVIFLLW